MPLLTMAAGARPRGYDRAAGEQVWFDLGRSQVGKFHVVTADGCNCKRYHYLGECSHNAAFMDLLGERHGMAS